MDSPSQYEFRPDGHRVCSAVTSCCALGGEGGVFRSNLQTMWTSHPLFADNFTENSQAMAP